MFSHNQKNTVEDKKNKLQSSLTQGNYKLIVETVNMIMQSELDDASKIAILDIRNANNQFNLFSLIGKKCLDTDKSIFAAYFEGMLCDIATIKKPAFAAFIKNLGLTGKSTSLMDQALQQQDISAILAYQNFLMQIASLEKNITISLDIIEEDTSNPDSKKRKWASLQNLAAQTSNNNNNIEPLAKKVCFSQEECYSAPKAEIPKTVHATIKGSVPYIKDLTQFSQLARTFRRYSKFEHETIYTINGFDTNTECEKLFDRLAKKITKNQKLIDVCITNSNTSLLNVIIDMLSVKYLKKYMALNNNIVNLSSLTGETALHYFMKQHLTFHTEEQIPINMKKAELAKLIESDKNFFPFLTLLLNHSSLTAQDKLERIPLFYWFMNHGSLFMPYHAKLWNLHVLQGITPETKCDQSKSILHCLSQSHNLAALYLVIKNAVNVNIQDDKGDTPLHLLFEPYIVYSQQRQDYENLNEKSIDVKLNQLALFIKNGADINAKNKLGFTPLHKLFHIKELGRFKYAILEKYLLNGADLSALDANGFHSFLHYLENASRYNFFQKGFLLEDNWRFTSEHYKNFWLTLQNEHIKIFDVLFQSWLCTSNKILNNEYFIIMLKLLLRLDNLALLNKVFHFDGSNPSLQLTADQEAVISSLFADPEKQYQHFLIKNDSIEILTFFIQKTTLFNFDQQTDNQGNSALHMAILYGSSKILKLLLDTGYYYVPRELDGSYHTPATLNKVLSKEKCNIHTPNLKGFTPIQLLMKYSNQNPAVFRSCFNLLIRSEASHLSFTPKSSRKRVLGLPHKTIYSLFDAQCGGDKTKIDVSFEELRSHANIDKWVFDNMTKIQIHERKRSINYP